MFLVLIVSILLSKVVGGSWSTHVYEYENKIFLSSLCNG